MENKKILANLIRELGVKIKQPNIPEEYIERLTEVLCNFIDELEMESKRIEIVKGYTKLLRDCIDANEDSQQLLNMISGYETTFFYDALIDCGSSENICKMMGVYNTLRCLTARGEIGLIYQTLKSTYFGAGIHFPEFFDELRDNEELFKSFMYELLADLEDIIIEDFDLAMMEGDTICG